MKSRHQNKPAEEGFTRLDLLVVVVALGLLALMLFPALARTKTDSRAFQCLKNNCELNRAWRMWTDDNQDLLLYSAELPSNPASYERAWVTGYMDFNPANSVNWDPQASIMKSPIWSYCGTNLSTWRCPSDQSYVVVNGVRLPRVRSYAMNLYLGGWGGTDGGWGSRVSNYRLFLRFCEINDPLPARLFIFADIRSDTVAGGNFATDMTGYSRTAPNTAQYTLWNLPAAYHDGAAAFSYADGRGELHRWVDPRTTPPLGFGQPSDTIHSPSNADVAWLQDRATRPK